MTAWASLALLRDNVIQYYTGTYLIFAICLVAFFLLALMATGLQFRYALAFTLPLLMALIAQANWFANYGWIANVFLIILATLYAYAIVKIWGGG